MNLNLLFRTLDKLDGKLVIITNNQTKKIIDAGMLTVVEDFENSRIIFAINDEATAITNESLLSFERIDNESVMVKLKELEILIKEEAPMN